MITYNRIAFEFSAFEVLLDGKVVGQINYGPNKQKKASGWYYKPKKSKTTGEVFATLDECKASIEE